MSYQYTDEHIIKIEGMQEEELDELWTEVKREYKRSSNINDAIEFDFISHIEIRADDFEDVFRVAISDFCKNDSRFIFLRGVYDMFSHYYERNSPNIKPLKNKDDVSRVYKSAKNKISELLDKYYIPEERQEFGIPELDLSTEEISKFMRVIDGILFEMELSPNDNRISAVNYANTALHWIGLPKTSIDKILTIFRRLQKEDPLYNT